MTTQTTAPPGESAETDSPPCDLDWLKTTKSPVATRVQTAQIFGVDERTITKGINDGDIPSVRVGRRMLVPVPALRRLLGIEDIR
jgi:excisionase family DNA binding protein